MNAVALDWIPKVLSPNARPHYMAKHKAVREYRATAFYRGRGQKRLQNPFVAVLPLVRTRRRRDIDNVLAGLKSALDGLSDAGWWSDDSAIKGFHLLPEHYSKSLERNLIVVVAGEDEDQQGISDAVTLIRGAASAGNLWNSIYEVQKREGGASSPPLT